MCQEADNSPQNSQFQVQHVGRSPKSQYPQYSTMLPPPPLPPMARPVAIIRSTGDLTMVGSPPSSITPPPGSSATMSSPHHQDQDQGSSTGPNNNTTGSSTPGNNGGNGTPGVPTSNSLGQTTNELSSSPPLSPQAHMDASRKSLTRIPSNPYSNAREYTSFNHFHTQSAPVSYHHFLFLIYHFLYYLIFFFYSYLVILAPYRQCLV